LLRYAKEVNLSLDCLDTKYFLPVFLDFFDRNVKSFMGRTFFRPGINDVENTGLPVPAYGNYSVIVGARVLSKGNIPGCEVVQNQGSPQVVP
jgi:hypothetical protein